MIHLDGFSGYGGFSLAFEQAGWKFDKTYFSEIDKYAIANYKYNHPNAIYAGSITDIPTNGIIDKLDLFTFGWPCQDNSIAGKRKGQTAGTRSGLLYSAVKIINKYKPRIFVAENVEGLRSVNKGIDIIESLKVLTYISESSPQYDVEMQLLNTRWYLPQNRERLFFIGHLRDGSSRQIFPIGESDFGVNERTTNTAIARCFTAGGHSGGMHSGMTLVRHRSDQPFKHEDVAPALRQGDKGEIRIVSNTKKGFEEVTENDSINFSFPNSKTRLVGVGVAQTLDKGCNQGLMVLSENYKRSKSQGGRVYNLDGISQTLNSGGGQGAKTGLYEIAENRARRLTPIETERLQGLLDNWTKYGIFEKKVWTNKKLKTFKIVEGIQEISDSQRYKLVGNGVSIPPVKMIAEKLKLAYNL